ncbi:MAG: histidinol dehydrogenase [Candidatus Thioglobus sp.]|nr:histidinol dehydrogenase [Candidatus Thioglobus sp.]
MITQLSSQQPDFQAKLAKLLAWETVANPAVISTVEEIIKNIRQRGDQALIDYSNQFDQTSASSMADLSISKAELKAAFEALDKSQKTALEAAAKRITAFHQKQKQTTWTETEADGTMLGQKITPLERVGLYVPGGKAAYPSSVLMNAIPATVAGVEELIMTVPTPHGISNPLVLAAAHISGVSQVFTIGGAQAIAALAYGTKTVAKVDKIVGPGNAYVSAAKRAVFGQVGIDMIAGPSEILIICDGKTDPDWIAMDLFSQAEHDENSQSILLCPDADFIKKVSDSIEKLLPEMDRKSIIKVALANRGALIQTKNIAEAIEISNQIAPEHLELSVENPEQVLEKIKHAGAIFMGKNTCEALGDYCAGPNHVLPTSGTARFCSPLGVYDFQKKSSLIFASKQSAAALGAIAATLADGEGLQAHARSARYRIEQK